MAAVRTPLTPAWRRLLDTRGLGSFRRLADAAGISHETVRRVVTSRAVHPKSVQAVADALGVDVELVRALRGDPEAAGEWTPPPASALLTADEREVVARLIGVMTKGRGGDGDDRDAAPMTAVVTDSERPEMPPGG